MIRAAVAATSTVVTAAMSPVTMVVRAMVTVGDHPVANGVHGSGQGRVLVAHIVAVADSEFLTLVTRQSD